MNKKIIYIFLFLLIGFDVQAQLKEGALGNRIVVRVADAMRALEHNYFEMEGLALDPVTNKESLKSKILLMQDNFAKIKSLNKNKALETSLAELKGKLKDLERAADTDNKDEIRRVAGRLFLTCFQCHNTHRYHVLPE